MAPLISSQLGFFESVEATGQGGGGTDGDASDAMMHGFPEASKFLDELSIWLWQLCFLARKTAHMKNSMFQPVHENNSMTCNMENCLHNFIMCLSFAK